QTCVRGRCVDVPPTCNGATDESCLLAPGLLALTISAGTLNPIFAETTKSYAVLPSITSLGAPFTVTATFSSGYTAAVAGSPVASGVPSAAIGLNLQIPTPIDVTVTPPTGPDVHYTIVVPPVEEAYAK